MSSDSEEEIDLENPEGQGAEDRISFDVPSIKKSVFLHAVFLNNTNEVEKLISKESGLLNDTDSQGNSALHLAVLLERLNMVDLLLKYKIDVDLQNYKGYTPLLLALLRNCNDSVINQLLKHKCNVNIISNTDSNSALHYATQYKSSYIVEQLIKLGADVNLQNASGFTPLHNAVFFTNMEAMCVLLYYNADVNVFCNLGSTPFMCSLSRPHEFAKILFNYYDDFTCMMLEPNSILWIAMQQKNPIATDIVKAGLDCGYTCHTVAFALEHAILIDDFELFQKTITPFFIIGLTADQFIDVLVIVIKLKMVSNATWVNYFTLLAKAAVQSPPTGAKNYCCTSELVIMLYNLNTDFSTREMIMWLFLSLGNIVWPLAIADCCDFFGNGREVEILFQAYNKALCHPGAEVGPICVPFEYFRLILVSPNTAHFKTQLFKYTIDVLLLSEDDFFSSKMYVGFMSYLPLFQSLIDTCVNMNQKLLIFQIMAALPVIPTLLELGRNAAALYIANSFKIRRQYQFFDIVNRANLPICIKEILLFRKPIYSV